MKNANLLRPLLLSSFVLLVQVAALNGEENTPQFRWLAPHYSGESASTKDSSLVEYNLKNSLSRSGSSSDEISSGTKLDDFSAQDAQLARLHGLGPAEISLLTSWQQNSRGLDEESLGTFAFPKRIERHKNPAESEDSILQLEENDIPANTLAPGWQKRSSGKSSKSKQSNRKNSGNRDKNSGKAEQEKLYEERKVPSGSAEGASSSPHFSSDLVDQSPSLPATPVVENVGRLNRNLAAQFLLRSPRENRQYDVPIIECPPAEDGMERFACPSPDRMRRYRCIDDHVLCDGFIDCPGAEDEDRQACMFYKTMKAHLDVVADALLRWVRGR